MKLHTVEGIKQLEAKFIPLELKVKSVRTKWYSKFLVAKPRSSKRFKVKANGKLVVDVWLCNSILILNVRVSNTAGSLPFRAVFLSSSRGFNDFKLLVMQRQHPARH